VTRALVKVEEASAALDQGSQQQPSDDPPQVVEGNAEDAASTSRLKHATTDATGRDTADKIPFGDFAGRKSRNTLRLIGNNIGGFGLTANSSTDKGPAIRKLANLYEADGLALGEMNLHWAHVPTKDCIPEQTLGWWKPFRQSTAYFKAWQTRSARQFGGVSVWSLNQLATHFIEDGTDPTGLGRWTSTQYRGKGQVRLRFISAYCPNRNDRGAATVWNQQKTFFEEKLLGIDPIDAFYEDLTKAVKQRLQDGDQLVLMLDLNDDIRTSPFTVMMQNIGMTQLLSYRHGDATMPRSFQHGQRPIDGLYVSNSLVGCSCGYLPFDDFDHRAIWIDIPYHLAFGHRVPPLAYRQPDRLNYQDPRCVAAYHKHYKVAEKCKRLFVRGDLIRWEGPGEYTSFDAEQWEKNERDRAEVRNYARKRCRKLRMGRKDYSPKCA
jgi:exonuclease III